MAFTDVVYALILGVVQGIAEFLPISSSAHLIIVSWLTEGKSIPLALNVGIHAGTFLAILAFFWKDWLDIFLALLFKIFKIQIFNSSFFDPEKSKNMYILLPGIILGSIPAGIVGILWEDDIEALFHNPISVIIPLIVFGVVLWYVDKMCKTEKKLGGVSIKDSVIIGIFQVLALIPGVSRSGITITGGRLLNINRADAARFSFLLGTPAMAGAVLLHVKDLMNNAHDLLFITSFVTSAVVGGLTIRFFLSFLQRFNFFWFAVYRVILGFFIFGVAFF